VFAGARPNHRLAVVAEIAEALALADRVDRQSNQSVASQPRAHRLVARKRFGAVGVPADKKDRPHWIDDPVGTVKIGGHEIVGKAADNQLVDAESVAGDRPDDFGLKRAAGGREAADARERGRADLIL